MLPACSQLHFMFPPVKFSCKHPHSSSLTCIKLLQTTAALQSYFAKLLYPTTLWKCQQCCSRAGGGGCYMEVKGAAKKFIRSCTARNYLQQILLKACAAYLCRWVLRMTCQKPPFLTASLVDTGWAAALSIIGVISSFACILLPSISILFSQIIHQLTESLFHSTWHNEVPNSDSCAL